MENRRIVLIGYRGTGKSSIGKAMAAILNVSHLDTDTVIETVEGRQIPEIFEKEGENGFRVIESEVIGQIPGSPAVISTGGGAVLKSENVRNLRKGSLMILLTSSEEEIAERISGTSRPSLTDLNPIDEIHSVLEERMPYYLAAADFVYDTTGKHPRNAAEEILRIIRPGIRQNREIKARKVLVSRVLSTPVPDASRQALKATTEDPDIRLYGILGYPCMHSLSPQIWNRLFYKLDLLARYTYFESPDPAEFIPLAEEAGVRGISVTIPHKEAIVPLLDKIHHDAGVIGAVNTVLLLGGKRYGYNTDWKGIYRPLESVSGKTAVILGAGGAATAAVYAVSMRGFHPVILNRNVNRAEDLALRSGAEYGPLSDFELYDADLVINATPVGMAGSKQDESKDSIPIPVSSLHASMTVFDLVYTPMETPLLQAAQKEGCSIIPGTEMFINQLSEQFKILTGIDVSVDGIREWIT